MFLCKYLHIAHLGRLEAASRDIDLDSSRSGPSPPRDETETEPVSSQVSDSTTPAFRHIHQQCDYRSNTHHSCFSESSRGTNKYPSSLGWSSHALTLDVSDSGFFSLVQYGPCAMHDLKEDGSHRKKRVCHSRGEALLQPK